MTYGRLRTFKTKNFMVALDYEPDSCTDLSWDNGEVAHKLDTGEYQCVEFRVTVYWNGTVLSREYLGQSIYADPAEFGREHIGLADKRRAEGLNFGCYFPQMVASAIAEARGHFANLPRLGAA